MAGAVFVVALETGCALVAATGLAVEIGAGPALTATGSTDPLANGKLSPCRLHLTQPTTGKNVPALVDRRKYATSMDSC